ncbi:protein-glutamate O-methyltransferase CheR [Simiduia sp. 21SJ11W-1]|uniref:CheR family methyltransferase n=1 Tax=Simiduia sp. 21SJ11W-1 TaxID=2909669 RepID=UPI00209F04A1|nr:protein-glutamate O-methyltransferase CheR [Simiduia sp. 21SJ11W-1]UTA49458.1 protein-glutamate O-methyltransferase CheR [Simiduia sp. 21SJ11W-1]
MSIPTRTGRDSLNPAHFSAFRDFLERACGIFLAENKQYLVTTRILPLLSHHGLNDLGELVQQLSSNRYTSLRDIVIDAMTTNETFWFRDTYPFELLKNTVFPELFAEQASVSIWSAACSSGQEPLSISMVAEESAKLHNLRIGSNLSILGTDLSPSMLKAARDATYDKGTVMRGLSAERLAQFFDALPDEQWRAKAQISQRIRYKPMNLQESFGGLGKFDVVFCRNVLIYFSHELKLDILTRIRRVLKPNGILFLGASEGLGGASELFDMVHCNPGILYRAK